MIKRRGYGVDIGAGRLLGAFTVLIPILAMAGVLLLLYGVVPFVSSHAIPTFRSSSHCAHWNSNPWSSGSLSLRSQPTYHGPYQALPPSRHHPTLFSFFSTLVLISAGPSLSSIFVRFPADSHLSDPDPSQPYIYRSSLGGP